MSGTDAVPAFRHDRPGTPAEAWAAAAAAAGPAPLRLVDRDGVPVSRLVVVAAHPDDETLGAGGLLASVLDDETDERPDVTVVLLTAGEASHPRSPTRSSVELAEQRVTESREALVALGGDASRLVCWHLGDGVLAASEETAVRRLTALVGDGRGVLLVGPWRHDGHTDHEAAGRICAAAARRTGARLLEYPVWFWHRADPAMLPWDVVVRWEVDAAASVAKHRAISCHRSQVEPLSSRPGDERLLEPHVLAHFEHAAELFVEQPDTDPALDRLHEERDEPWHADTRWYEERKRALVLAMLPSHRHGATLEVGCSTGVLAAALAARCSRVLAVDSSDAAVRAARQRVEGLDNVVVERRDLPAEWPPGRFDLVVVSEVGYFLSPRDLERLVAAVVASLADDGVVVLCHWRHDVEGWVLDGRDVHTAFEAGAGWSRLATYRDDDVELLLLGPSTRMPEPTA